jgi:hypothetical protein
VVNLFDLRTFTLVKTVPIMEELEGVVLLSAEHSAALLEGSFNNTSSSSSGSKKKQQSNGTTTTLVMVTAGEQGVLKFFKVEYPSKSPASVEVSPLLHFALSQAQRNPALASLNSSSGGGAAAGTSSSSSSADAVALRGVASLHYLPATGEVLSVTKDFNLCSYSM